MNTETLLRDEIQKEIEELSRMELGTEEYKTTVDGITKMTDRVIEMTKIDLEYRDRLDARESEEKLKREEMRDQKRGHFVNDGITILGIVLPVTVTIWGTIKSFKFEETGTITTIMGRGFIQNMLPKKK